MSNRTLYHLTPEILLRAYAMGIFPMAEGAESAELNWYDPPIRALIPLDEYFHVPRRLARTIRQQRYQVTLNRAFEDVMRGCAASAEGRETTWINEEIIRVYTKLHQQKNAHSIEVWDGDNLIGGVYGVSLGGAFCGESMFSRQKDASKIALVHLVALLRGHHYTLLDTQFLTSHLERFGTFEIARSAYQLMLGAALKKKPLAFAPHPNWSYLLAGVLSLQPVTQIS